jgi:hypothetical protein
MSYPKLAWTLRCRLRLNDAGRWSRSSSTSWLALLVCLSQLLATEAFSQSQQAPPSLQRTSPTPRDPVDMAIDRGLNFLLTLQRNDGAITEKDYDTTMTALAIMALASTGVTPSSPGPRGDAVRNGLNFVLREDRQEPTGYYGNRDGSRMYGHGIITLMLSELLGMGSDALQDQLIQLRCQRAIDLILSAQQASKPVLYRGGWRYSPNSNDSDLSVSVWHLMALRSAKNDGWPIPANAIQDAIGFLERSYTVRLDSRGQPAEPKAGFGYLPESNQPSFAMTAAGLLALQVCGEYDSPLVSGAAEWLLDHPPQAHDRFFFYGMYYYAQGMYQRGGVHAETANRLVSALLLERQQADGSWAAPSGEELGAGRSYATSLAILSLSVKYHYLPIYQR